MNIPEPLQFNGSTVHPLEHLRPDQVKVCWYTKAMHVGSDMGSVCHTPLSLQCLLDAIKLFEAPGRTIAQIYMHPDNCETLRGLIYEYKRSIEVKEYE